MILVLQTVGCFGMLGLRIIAGYVLQYPVLQTWDCYRHNQQCRPRRLLIKADMDRIAQPTRTLFTIFLPHLHGLQSHDSCIYLTSSNIAVLNKIYTES